MAADGCPICMRSLPSSTVQLFDDDEEKDFITKQLGQTSYFVETGCCGQKICRDCKNEWSKRSLRCPYCNESSSQQRTLTTGQWTNLIEEINGNVDDSVFLVQQHNNDQRGSSSPFGGLIPVCFTSIALTAVSFCVYLLTNTR